MRSTLRSRISALAALTVVAACSAASPALAAPGTFDDGGTAKVTISDTTPRPGDTLTITGTGFDNVSGAGSQGVPTVAVRPNDEDDPYGTWTFAGDVWPQGPAEAKIWFKTNGSGGFSGTIRIPTTTPTTGPGTGAEAGMHWLRVLSGAEFTSTGYPNPAAALAAPASIRALFRVQHRVELGLTTVGSVNPGVFVAGTTFRTGAPIQVTARGSGFSPSTAVDVTLDGSPVSIVTVPATSPVSTDASGALPTGLRLNLGSTVTPGQHTLTVSTGTGPTAVSESQQITVLPAATGAIDTPRLRPGGLLSFRFNGWRGITGAGQKVAVALNNDTKPIACVQADATGSGSGVVRLPTTTPADATGPTPPAAGANTVRFLAGTSCAGPTGPVNDLPGGMVPVTLTVSDTAPTATAPASAQAGSSFAVSGAGFGTAEQIAVTLDGAALGTVTSAADGTFSGQLALPVGTSVGAHVLKFASPTETALAELTTTAASTGGGTDTTPPASVDPPVDVPPVVTPPVVMPPVVTPVAPKLTAAKVLGGRTLRLTLAGTKGRKVAVTVRTTRKVRVSARSAAKIVTLVSATTTKTGAVSFTVRSDGRKALKRLRKLSVVVTLKPSGGKAVTKTVTLRA
jgi:hypothetical protein